ncbi:MAG: cytochrome c3 family protein [Proteobacteria bacterium]|nr:cytochrome c3 family protein [Pseudomonadota bacterium]
MKKMILFIAVLLISILLGAACNRKAVISEKPLSDNSHFLWNQDARCADCHAAEVKSMTDSTLLASGHAAAGNTCSDCHDIKDLQKAHEEVDTKPPVPSQKYSSALCFKCHGNYKDIIELTKGRTRLNPHDSHYGEIDCFICHKVHAAKSPDEFCVSCHTSMN